VKAAPAAVAVLALAFGAAANAAADLSGVWLATGPRQGVGAMPELTAQAAADRAAFDPLDDPVLRCVPPGFPRSGPMIYPLQIVQTEKLVLFLYETFGMIRRIYMDGRSPPEYLPPTLMGYSLGHWEGDELVIHTDHYAPGLLAGDGLRQYGDLTVDERYRLVDEGRGLHSVETITAPGTFAKPWRREFTWELDPHGMIYESICDPKDSRF
jgi:hypothetical protein